MRAPLRLCFVWLAVLPVAGLSQGPSPSVRSSRASELARTGSHSKPPHVGTWRSIGNDLHELSGELVSRSGPENDNSFIIFDGVGHFAVTNLPISTLKLKPSEELTPDEALEIVAGRSAPNRSASAYFGTYTLNMSDRYVVNHVLGMVNLVELGTDRFRLFEFSGNRLFLKILPLRRSDRISWRVWERVPDTANLGPAHGKFIGFWRVISNERRKVNGDLVSSMPIDAGYIVYASSGRMALHVVQPNRKRWASVQPTPAESKTALTTYTAYTAPYAIDAEEHVVVHHGAGPVSGQKSGDGRYFYRLSGSRLILTSPRITANGQEVYSVITGERVSGDNPADQP